MVTIEGIESGIIGMVDDVKEFVGANTGAVIGGTALTGALVGASIVGIAKSKSSSSRKKRRSHKKIMHTKRGLKQDRKRHSKQKWEVAYRKRKAKHHKKSKSKRGVHYTKNGQPYKIMANGRARFVKK
jgi:hypothetical protein